MISETTNLIFDTLIFLVAFTVYFFMFIFMIFMMSKVSEILDILKKDLNNSDNKLDIFKKTNT